MTSVIKANGKKEQFSEEKVLNSIRRARIPQNLQAEVLMHVKGKLYDGISTEEIYRHIMEFLTRAPEPYVESRYSLKQAIMALGPTGYPFEDFFAQLLEANGYHTKTRQVLAGKCVTHEIDVVAQKDGKTAIVEAKFHNTPGTRTEVQVALYTQARFQDIKFRNKADESWIITNTKATVDAETYAICMGMKVISWDFPHEGGSLREMIERSNLHPITMLTTLSQSAKNQLLNNHIVLCKQLLEQPMILETLSLSREDREKVMAEAKVICQQEN
ncbi:MAG: ATP cone domain-containing protein [Patescibacteria group bacterium]